jgi:hypothetical protein
VPVIDEKNAGQITEEIQATGNVIKPENGPTHHQVASPSLSSFDVANANNTSVVKVNL